MRGRTTDAPGPTPTRSDIRGETSDPGSESGVASPPDSPGPETRDRLLEAAEHLFATRGYRGASVRQIARRARCNVSLVGYYFGSKEGLLREVMRPRIRRLRGVIDQLGEVDRLTEAHLRAFLESLVVELDDHRPFFRLMFSELLREDSPLDPAAMEPIWDNQRAAMAVLERAVRQGLVRGDLDLGFVMTSLFGAIALPMLVPRLARGVLGDDARGAMTSAGATNVAEILFRGILERDRQEEA